MPAVTRPGPSRAARRSPLAAALLALPLAACSVVGVRTAQEPPFELVEMLPGGVEVRRYGPRLAAEATATGPTEAARSAAFRRLAGYIFGGNDGAVEIAMTAPVETGGERIVMTAPVETTGGTADLRMRFFMPEGMSIATAPRPRDPGVALVELPAEVLAVRRFSGSTGSAALARETAALLDHLAASAWRPTGEPRAWFYDPPWTLPWLRRNEVAVAVAPR